MEHLPEARWKPEQGHRSWEEGSNRLRVEACAEWMGGLEDGEQPLMGGSSRSRDADPRVEPPRNHDAASRQATACGSEGLHGEQLDHPSGRGFPHWQPSLKGRTPLPIPDPASLLRLGDLHVLLQRLRQQ